MHEGEVAGGSVDTSGGRAVRCMNMCGRRVRAVTAASTTRWGRISIRMLNDRQTAPELVPGSVRGLAIADQSAGKESKIELPKRVAQAARASCEPYAAVLDGLALAMVLLVAAVGRVGNRGAHKFLTTLSFGHGERPRASCRSWAIALAARRWVVSSPACLAPCTRECVSA